MQILQDAGVELDPRISRFVEEWANDAEEEIQYEMSVVQSLCVALLSSLLGASWAILVAVVVNAETALLWWQWVLVWVPILMTVIVLTLGVPYFLKCVREKKRGKWQATVKEKTGSYAEYLKLKDDIDAQNKLDKK